MHSIWPCGLVGKFIFKSTAYRIISLSKSKYWQSSNSQAEGKKASKLLQNYVTEKLGEENMSFLHNLTLMVSNMVWIA